MTDSIDLAGACATFDEPWQPRTVATLNDYDIRVAKAMGEFPSHRHPDTEFVMVEPSETVNTANAPSTMTAVRRVL